MASALKDTVHGPSYGQRNKTEKNSTNHQRIKLFYNKNQKKRHIPNLNCTHKRNYRNESLSKTVYIRPYPCQPHAEASDPPRIRQRDRNGNTQESLHLDDIYWGAFRVIPTILLFAPANIAVRLCFPIPWRRHQGLRDSRPRAHPDAGFTFRHTPEMMVGSGVGACGCDHVLTSRCGSGRCTSRQGRPVLQDRASIGGMAAWTSPPDVPMLE